MRMSRVALAGFLVLANACSNSRHDTVGPATQSTDTDAPKPNTPAVSGTCAIETQHVTDPGPDGAWRTTDDILAARVITADGFRAQFEAGPDGRLGTADDQADVSISSGSVTYSRTNEGVLVSIEAMPANNGVYRATQMGQGLDALWFSADDEIKVTYSRIEGAPREGLLTQYFEGTRPGPDATWGTPDDDLGLGLVWRYELAAADMSIEVIPYSLSDIIYAAMMVRTSAATKGYTIEQHTIVPPTRGEVQEWVRNAPSIAKAYWFSDGEDGLYSTVPGSDGFFGTSDDVPTFVWYGNVSYSSPGTDGEWPTVDDNITWPGAERKYSVATTYGTRTYRQKVGPDQIFDTSDDTVSGLWDRVDFPQGGAAYYFVTPYWPSGDYIVVDSKHDASGRPILYSLSWADSTYFEIKLKYPDEPWPAAVDWKGDLSIDNESLQLNSGLWFDQPPDIPAREWSEVTITNSPAGYPKSGEAYTRKSLSTCPRAMPQFVSDFDDVEQIQALQIQDIGR